MSTLLTHATSGPKTAGKRRKCSHQNLVAMWKTVAEHAASERLSAYFSTLRRSGVYSL